MKPIFLPSAALDALDELGPKAPSPGRLTRLQKLRDEAQASGAHVLLLIWPTLDWALLAVKVPSDVVIRDALQLVPNVLAIPDTLEQLYEKARQGRHLTQLQLEHRPAITH